MAEGTPETLPKEVDSNTLYAVHAVRDGVQIPTFLLDANIQGIMGPRHARQIARDILGWKSGTGITVSKL